MIASPDHRTQFERPARMIGPGDRGDGRSCSLGKVVEGRIIDVVEGGGLRSSRGQRRDGREWSGAGDDRGDGAELAGVPLIIAGVVEVFGPDLRGGQPRTLESGPVETGDGSKDLAAVESAQLDAKAGRAPAPPEDRQGMPWRWPSAFRATRPDNLVAVDPVIQREAVEGSTIGSGRRRKIRRRPVKRLVFFDPITQLGFSPLGSGPKSIDLRAAFMFVASACR
jgi:hypothetical protein